MRKILIALLAALLIFGCLEPVEPPSTGNTSGTVTASNDGGITIVSQPEGNGTMEPAEVSPDYTTSLGDRVWVDYTLYVQGKVHDTSNATLANESGIFNPYRTYQPLSYVMDFNKGIIDGFIVNTLNMKVNETVVFNVDPARGYGPYDTAKVVTTPRYYEMDMYETIPRSYLEARGINISKGEGFNTDVGTVFIDSFDEENVTLFYLLTPGQKLSFGGVPEQVVSVNNLTARLEFMLEMDKTYNLPHPQTGALTAFKVIGKDDETITLDGNHPLANETLRFEVTLLAVEPSAVPATG